MHIHSRLKIIFKIYLQIEYLYFIHANLLHDLMIDVLNFYLQIPYKEKDQANTREIVVNWYIMLFKNFDTDLIN